MPPLRRLTTATLACLALAGCTGSGAGDKLHKTLQSVVLQQHDFPPSWHLFDPPTSQSDVLGRLADCTGAVRDRTADVAAVRSAEFRKGQQHITSMAVAYESQQAVSQRMASLGSPKADECIAQVIQGQVLTAVPGASTISRRFTVTPGAINVAANVDGQASGVVKVSRGGRPVDVYVDVGFITGPMYYAELTFIGVGDRIAEYIRRALTNDVAYRVQRT